MVRPDETDHETWLLAMDAIRLHGRHAAAVVAGQAESLFAQGDVEGACQCRLIVLEIERIEAEANSGTHQS